MSAAEVDRRLEGLDGWRKKGKFITKEFEFENFMDGISFIGMVAAIAEREEHHPDIRVRYTKVTLLIQTHSEGGVTEWDIGLARSIERALSRRSLKAPGQKVPRFAK